MNEPAGPVILAPQDVTITGFNALVTLSDGTIRNLVMTEPEARKAMSILTHKVFGGRLKLSAQPVNSVQSKAAEAPERRIIVP